MRYLHSNKDGSVGLWATIPVKIIRDKDGAEFKVIGIRRRNGNCLLYGGWIESGKGGEFAVGDDKTDASDLPVDCIQGHTLVFPDFETEVLTKLHPETQAQIAGFRSLKGSEVPADRTFRAAWRDGKTEVATDMASARDIWRDKMRRARAPQFSSLDMQYLRADETADAQLKQDIVAQKQELRDVTADPSIEEAQTPEELKAVWPSILG